MKRALAFVLLCLLSITAVDGQQNIQTRQRSSPRAAKRVSESSVRRFMRALASDKAKGRGSATEDERRAGVYIASQLRRFGIKPAGDDGRYLQTVKFTPRPRKGQNAADVKEQTTTNVVGILRGRDPVLSKETILLSAHMDHLGVGRPVNGDSIYNGADDDASGVTAVLELANILGHGRRPKRTIVFALFGSEEIGGYGARYFLEHPPVELPSIVANLEFEMIGRPDPAVASNQLWLTGYDMSDLGKTLAAHGAYLVADPHPEQHFFERSDNYALAKRGVVAHTVSSFGLHKQYHQPDDDLAHIDFVHMTRAIASMVSPVRWLANSSFRPAWVEGKKP